MADPTNTALGHARESFWNSDQRARIQANNEAGNPVDLTTDVDGRLLVNTAEGEQDIESLLEENNRYLRIMIVMLASATGMEIPNDPGGI